MSKSKSAIFSILVAVLALALGATCLVPSQSANAWRLEPEAAATLDDGNGGFVQSELTKLYGMLVDGATTVAQLNAAATRAATDANGISGTGASNFAQPEAVVMLGNKKWTPVHLTKDSSGNTILTLWLAWTTDVQSWSAFKLYDSKRQTQYDAYPVNMYSSSYIRAYLNGTDFLAEAGATQLSSGSDVQSDEWKVFLASFGDYIVAPSQVAYQANERSSAVLPGFRENAGNIIVDPFDNLNEGYAESGVKYNADCGYDYRAKTGYSDWQQDKLWLPSLSETGHGHYTVYKTDSHGVYYFPEGEKYDAGLWNTTWNQTTTGSSQQYDAWLRSGDSQNAVNPTGDRVYTLSLTGTMGTVDAETSNYVRPAIHLNLTAISQGMKDDMADKPQSQNITALYDGEQHSLSIADYAKMNFDGVPAGAQFEYGRLSAVNAGTYTLRATPKAGTWSDGTASPVTFTLRIAPRPVEVSVGGDTEGGYHILGQTPTIANLRLYSVVTYAADRGFVGDDDIEDLGAINPVLTSRSDGKTYRLGKDMPVGTYDVEIANGVYNNYNVTFVKSAAFGRTEECVYTVLPTDDVAVLVSGYLVVDGTVTVPYDGKAKYVGLLNLGNYVNRRSVEYYQDGVKLPQEPVAAGTYTVRVTGSYTAEFTLVINDDFLPPLKPAEADLTLTKTYTGTVITLHIVGADKMTFGAVPDGATLEGDSLSAVNAGVYRLTARPTDGQWRDGTSGEVTFVLTVLKADIDMSRVEYRVGGYAPYPYGFSVGYNGLPQEATAINLPDGVQAEPHYFIEDAPLSAPPKEIGSYIVWFSFTVADPTNYNVPEDKGFNLYIVKGVMDLSGASFTVDGQAADGDVFHVVYDGNAKALIVADLPSGIGCTVSYYNGDRLLPEPPVNAGRYTAKVEFVGQDPDGYELPMPRSYTIVVAKADISLSDVRFTIDGLPITGSSVTFECDGSPKSLSVSGLPQGVSATVEYVNGDVRLDGAPTEAGDYTIRVTFAVSNDNYNAPQDKQIRLTITPGSDEPVGPDAPDANESAFPWWWIVVGVGGAGAVAAVTVLLCLRRRKRK